MRLYSFFVLLIYVHFNLNAQSKVDDSVLVLHSSLLESIDLGLQYLEATQRKESVEHKYYKGEWPSQMCMQKGFILLGSKRAVDDSNCFSIASIHNELASLYLDFPEYRCIPRMLDLAFGKMMSYRNGDKFNFWNLLPPNRKLKKNDVIGEQPMVRRPTNFELKSKYINNAANIAEDADDTSLAYAAIALRKRYKKAIRDSFSLSIGSVAPIFEEYVDINRDNRHWYNYLYGNDHDTGAYLTWLSNEYEFKNWNIIKVIGHNATFFLPFSECYPHAYIPYIPYGSNDLDGVVNANVLTTLAHYNELDAEGVDAAINFIEKKCEAGHFDRVGIYYPNRYHFPYAVSKAYYSGVHRLKQSVEYLYEYILETQNDDGSWSARCRVNKKDELQSTAYALNTLLFIGNFDERSLTSIDRAIDYILKHSIIDSQGMHWKGGVFFSGGTVVRNVLVWKSDAYTTAIILRAFSNYRKYLENAYKINQLENYPEFE